MERTDVVVIGAGLVGAAAAFELASRGVGCLVLEAAAEVAAGASRSNSGVVHTGFDSPPGTLETQMIRAQAGRWQGVFDALGIPYRVPGALLLATDNRQAEQLPVIAERAAANGVAVELLDAAELRRIEPGATGVAGLLIPGEAITDPIAVVRRLLSAGPEVRLACPVLRVERDGSGVSVVTAHGTITAQYAINCAGLYADAFADETFKITPRRGEFVVYGPGTAGLVQHILLPMPTAETKGVLVFPTLVGNLCAGPSAVDQDDKEDWRPRPLELARVRAQAALMLPALRGLTPIDAWAGLRPAGRPHNYVVEWSSRVPALLHVAGIRSTGLSACLGLAQFVAGQLAQRGLPLATPRLPDAPAHSVEAAPWWQQLNALRGIQPYAARD